MSCDCTPRYGDPDNTLLFKIACLLNRGGGGGGAGVSSFNSRTGAVTLNSGDVTAALGYTPQPALGYTPENVANKSNDTTMSADSATLYPSQHAAKTYADGKLALTGGVLSGDLDISTGIHLDTDGSASFGVGGALFSTAGDLSFSGTTHAGLRLNNLTTAQRNAIAAPQDGMLIYNTTLGRFDGYSGGAWLGGFVKLSGDTMLGPLLLTGGGTTNWGLTLKSLSTASRNLIAATPGMLIWNLTTNHLEAVNQSSVWEAYAKQVGDTFTGLIQFSGITHAGLRLNNLTTAERDAIVAPTAGMLIWNTTTAAVNQYSGAAWSSISGGSAPPFSDATAILMGSADATKLLRFEIDGFTTATTRVLTPQNSDYTIAGIDIAQTFTAKQTLTPPADTTALGVTGFSLTGASTAPMFDLAGTWNTSGVATALKLNMTNTASGAGSLLLDLQIGGSSLLNFSKDALLQLGDGTAPAGDPTAAILQWSAGGEWQYRAATASEGAGQTNRVHNRGETVIAAGTDYSLTTTSSRVDFGTTDPEVTLPTAGTYLVTCDVRFFSSALSANDIHVASLYNATDATDIPGDGVVSLGAAIRASVSISVTVTVTASKLIQIYAYNITAARGQVEAAKISYIRLY